MDSKKSTLSLSLPKGTVKNNAGDAEGKIRQSFSHGKSKVVAVEVKKKRFAAGPVNRFKKPADTPLNKLQKTGLTSDEVTTRLNVVKQAIKVQKEETEREIQEAAIREAEMKKAKDLLVLA